MKRTLISGICLAALISVAPAQAQRAEVIHWWTSGGESAAVKVFAQEYDKAGGTWVDSAVAGGANARTAAINRVVGGDPPTAMQFNTGKQFDDLVEGGMLVNLDALAKSMNWKGIMPPAILDAVTRDGHVYAAPVDIHGQNWLFYSTAALAKAGAQPPTNWDDVFPVLDKLKAAGLIPLALGGQKTWERNLFNAVLAGKGGAAMYEAFWGKRDPALLKTPGFHAVADTYKRLHDYIDPSSPGRNWNDSTALVIQGKAGMHVNGDWAKGEFTAAGQTAGKEYGCTILGGTGANQGVSYLLGGDVFAFPKQKSAEATAAQLKLADIMLEPATQIAFSLKKGSIPSRLDVDFSKLDMCAQKAGVWLADKKTQVPSNELLAPPSVTGAVEDVISQFWNNQSMTSDMFITGLTSALAQQL